MRYTSQVSKYEKKQCSIWLCDRAGRYLHQSNTQLIRVRLGLVWVRLGQVRLGQVWIRLGLALGQLWVSFGLALEREFTKSIHENSLIFSTKIHLLCPREVCHPKYLGSSMLHGSDFIIDNLVCNHLKDLKHQINMHQ